MHAYSLVVSVLTPYYSELGVITDQSALTKFNNAVAFLLLLKALVSG